MKKRNWVRYGSADGIIEITLRDSSNQKLEEFKTNWRNKTRLMQICSILDSKWNIKLFKDKEDMFEF